ncbi:MAG: hypothetical protein WC819_05440 [Parcubacteria group bacterium]|jgi:hypothetical protein
MPEPKMLRRAQVIKRKKAAIPTDLLANFCGFTHIALKVYCRKIKDPQRLYKKSARPYEGFIFIHLTDAKDHMDQRPYCVLRINHCSLGRFRATVERIFSSADTIERILNEKELTH